ncbi:MAG TPA: hypothetical protein PKY05_15885, partial [Fibrobacteria bacterium]|nr:hypothetical protein [Fibrobacteria bacterium]
MAVGNILLVGDDFRSNAKIAPALARRGWELSASPLSWDLVVPTPSHVVVNMREDAITCMDLVGQMRKAFPHCRLVVMAGWASIGAALEAARRGA